jgi:dolichol-phosphate mannosyltransferase
MSNKVATIIIPTYNETDSIERLIKYFFDKTFKEIKEWRMKILIIDANFPGSNVKVVKRLLKKYSDLGLLTVEKKEGIGAAYIKGFKYAIDNYKADVLIEFDGVFQYPPEIIPIMLNEINNGYDYVLGSERIKRGVYPSKWGLKRIFLSKFSGFVLRFLFLFPFKHFFSITNPFSKIRVLKVNEYLKNIKLNDLANSNHGFKVFLLCNMINNEVKIKEILLKNKDLNRNDSTKINCTLYEILKLIIYFRINDGISLKFIKFCFVGLLGLFINSFFLEFFARINLLNRFVLFFSSFKKIPVLNILSTKSAWAAGISGELAIINNFIFNNLLTFYKNKIKGFFKILLKFLLFNLTSIGSVAIQFILIGMSVLFFGEKLIVRQITLVVTIFFIVVPYNWLMYNKVIWNKKKNIVNNYKI